jgi:hypothetical protein
MSSQAIACTTARSSGGKIGLAPASRFILQRKIPERPAASPTPNPIDRHVNRGGSFRVPNVRLLVQQTDQGRSLPQLKRSIALPLKALGFAQELVRERGTMRRFGAAHGWHPVALRSLVSIRTVPVYQGSKTWSLFVKQTTKAGTSAFVPSRSTNINVFQNQEEV